MKKTFARSYFGLSTKGCGEHLFYPRRATKDHEEHLCKIIFWSVHEGRGRTPFLSTKGHEGPRRTPLQGHNLVCPRRAAENTFFIHEGPRRTTKNTFARSYFGLSTKGCGEHLFYPRRAAKDHEENLCKIIFWSVHEGRGRTPLQGHNLGCPRRAAEKTFLIHEGPRRTTKKTFARSYFGLSTKGCGENLFDPRRATKDHEENLCEVIIWVVHEGPRRQPFEVDGDHGRR